MLKEDYLFQRERKWRRIEEENRLERGSCPGGTGQCDSAPSAPRHIYTNCTGEKSEERSEVKQGGIEGASEDALRRCR